MDPIRISEWGRVRVPELTTVQRQSIATLAADWKIAHRLNTPPLAFEGVDGATLVARQFVGVVETEGVTIEIYPKLDREIPDNKTLTGKEAVSTLKSLLWMLDVSGYEELVETGDGSLHEAHDTFPDLFALLMARRLREELALGVPHRYERREDDLHAVRGRLLIGAQVTRNLDRWDKIACAFDEFTPDTPVCRILRCACRELRGRVRQEETRRLLSDCLCLLEDVSDISVPEAIRSIDFMPPWSRSLERFRRTFTLAARLLRGFSHELLAGTADTFVFLLDMNKVFESFAAAALRAQFGVPIETQKRLGTLLQISPGGIQQNADFYWRTNPEEVWIGDAKYKHLTAGMTGSLTFAKDETNPAGRFLSPNDIRQLTVYAELCGGTPKPNLALLYPYNGSREEFRADSITAWNGSNLWLVPLFVRHCSNLADALPANFAGDDSQNNRRPH